MIPTPVACVLDASVGIKLVLNEALSTEAHALAAHLAQDPAAQFHVPDFFDMECANVLWKHVQRSGYPLSEAQRSLATLLSLAFQRMPVTALAGDALTIAASFGISAYDACYIAASRRLGLPLVTADPRLVARMANSSYVVLDLGTTAIPSPPP
jgi:predicted nucleic acid-binding protein